MSIASLSKVTFVSLLGLSLVGAGNAQEGSPFLVTKDQSMAAFVEGPACAQSVKMNFFSQDADAFARQDGDAPSTASRLMNNVTSLVRQTCPSVDMVRSAGKVVITGGSAPETKTVYTGIADKASSWTVLELGARNSGGLLNAGPRTGETPELPDFLASPTFEQFNAVQTLMANGETQCTNFDSSTETCTLLTTFELDESGALTMVTQQLVDEHSDAVGTARVPGNVSNGLWCGDPNAATVVATGGDLVPGSAKQVAMGEMLLERLQDVGDEVCVGYERADSGLKTIQFDDEGFQLFSAMDASIFDTAKALRRE